MKTNEERVRDLLAYLAGGLLALPLERRLLSHSI